MSGFELASSPEVMAIKYGHPTPHQAVADGHGVKAASMGQCARIHVFRRHSPRSSRLGFRLGQGCLQFRLLLVGQ